MPSTATGSSACSSSVVVCGSAAVMFDLDVVPTQHGDGFRTAADRDRVSQRGEDGVEPPEPLGLAQQRRDADACHEHDDGEAAVAEGVDEGADILRLLERRLADRGD